MINYLPLSHFPAQAVESFFREHWQDTVMAIRGQPIDLRSLDGFVALKDDQLIGLISYQINPGYLEIVSLDSLLEGQGIASTLIDLVESLAHQKSLTTIRLITTNDNLKALAFYQKRGYYLYKLFPNALEKARQLKPSIPLVSDKGIPIRDELELIKHLTIEKETNMSSTINYITTLCNIPSPTGFTTQIMDYVQNEVESFGYSTYRTPKGGLMVTVKGLDDSKHRVVTAHLDTLGAMVRAIKPDGRLKMDLVGGFVYNAIEGENCTVHVAKTGKTVSGTMLMHQTSVHVYRDAGSAERNQANMEVRLDEKVTTAEETRALGIEVGDFISFDPRVVVTDNGFIKSRHLDDKVSAAILLNLLKVYKEEKVQLPHTTHFYFSAFEEVGHGANSSLPDQTVEYLAVDMGAMGDDQQTDEYTVSICVKDGSGPYHYELRQHLVALAEANAIPYKLDIYPYYGSDASAAMRAGADVKHALLGAGIESSHSYERTHTDSVVATEQLVDAYLKSGTI